MEGSATVEVFEPETENVKVSVKVGNDLKKSKKAKCKKVFEGPAMRNENMPDKSTDVVLEISALYTKTIYLTAPNEAE